MSRSMRHATLALLLAPIACGEAEGPVAPIHELPRELTAVERQVITRSNAFGLDLLAEVHAAEDGPNVFLSPFSASMALGMTLNGAVAGTFDAMRTALRLEGVTQEEINTSYEGLLDLLLGLDPSVTLAIGNS
ncbi:MAG: serpin family protein, partial [Longimicrobiales bacterium]